MILKDIDLDIKHRHSIKGVPGKGPPYFEPWIKDRERAGK